MSAPVVTIVEHAVFEAVCLRCPWTSGGHLEREWAEHVAGNHETAEHPNATEEPTT